MEVLELENKTRKKKCQPPLRSSSGKLYYPAERDEDDDFVITQELLDRLEIAREQIRNGEFILCKTKEESRRFLESL